MPNILNSESGSWEMSRAYLKTGDNIVELGESLVEVNIIQSIYDPYEIIDLVMVNDLSIDSNLPIIIGTTIYFSYKMNGIKYSRTFRLTALEYPDSTDKSKPLRLTGITKEFFDAALKKSSLSYKNMGPDDILYKNGIGKLFQTDPIEKRTYVVPNGENHIDFVNKALPKLESPDYRKKSRILKTKEGYSICNFDTFTEKMKSYYSLTSQGPIPLFYRNSSMLEKLKTKNQGLDGSEKTKLENLFSVTKVYTEEARSFSKSMKHKEFSYIIDEFDPFRKKYNIYHYKQSKNINKNSSLYMKEDENAVPGRFKFINCSSPLEKNSVMYTALQNSMLFNRSGFSSQNLLCVEMYSNVLLEVGLEYHIDIPMDSPASATKGNMKDPILSGTKYSIMVKHIFKPNSKAITVMTLAGDGGMNGTEHHESSKLGKS